MTDAAKQLSAADASGNSASAVPFADCAKPGVEPPKHAGEAPKPVDAVPALSPAAAAANGAPNKADDAQSTQNTGTVDAGADAATKCSCMGAVVKLSGQGSRPVNSAFVLHSVDTIMNEQGVQRWSAVTVKVKMKGVSV